MPVRAGCYGSLRTAGLRFLSQHAEGALSGAGRDRLWRSRALPDHCRGRGMQPAPAGLIVASPANPTGTIIPPDEVAAIAAVCRRRGIRVISDEIYHGLSYVGPARSLLQEMDDALIVNSFSKYFSMAGWRLGWLVVPGDLID